MFAQVILSKASPGIDRDFTYSIPADLKDKVVIGSQVQVSFGRRKDIGYVVGLSNTSSVKGIKPIISVTNDYPLFSEKQLELAKWLSSYYGAFLITSLRLMMPPGIKQKENRKRVRAAKPVTKNVVRGSEQEGQSEFALLEPTKEQEKALAKILAALDSEKAETFLLYGVTGSGKTEVYMQAIVRVLQMQKSAIVLVPEISLTPQLIERFSSRFPGLIAILHSHLTIKQRNEEWKKVAMGEAKIILGARSAIFAPVTDLGLVVIDEEYENSYKSSDKSPRYHVREVAAKLSELHHACVILGSATPSVETYYRAQSGEYTKLTLSQRIDNRVLPPVEIVDMRTEKEYVLSQKLRNELRQTLERKEQAILFINRRGFFTFVMCKECGFSIECPTCSVALSFHSQDKRLRCNRCNYNTEAPLFCPRCNSQSIRYFGTGTQRIEKEVADVFPAARILRYDQDSVSKRGSHEAFFSTFAKHKADVLIGTQMVAKGLDVANVTLVGVVSADTALKIPDFRSGERTFQLLTQVAGRAGRHHLPGKVIVQTHDPSNYVIQTAAKHDYDAFYNLEIEYRKDLSYPPFAKLIYILISSENGKLAMKTAEELASKLKCQVLGPAAAVIPRLRGAWRVRLLLKGENIDQLQKDLDAALKQIQVPDDIKISIDVEPMGMI